MNVLESFGLLGYASGAVAWYKLTGIFINVNHISHSGLTVNIMIGYGRDHSLDHGHKIQKDEKIIYRL